MEKRYINNSEFRFTEEGDKKYIEGYALVFDSESKDLGGFIEVIDRSSINESTDLSDVVALINHDSNFVLARKNEEANTLFLQVDEKGLKYRFEIDEEISYQKDLYRNVMKGNLSKSSFAFTLPRNGSGEKWEKRTDGKYIRTIKQFASIQDVSVVTNPAYHNTVSLSRSFEEIKKEFEESKNESNLNEYMYKYISLNTK
ncbi:HK97 family phage prohead protease [Algoriphagus sp. AK58]|uniref:HK97 family phage prohead protease n=1 Tax=Algoriphagus sp. AK58 TaxID=1406877 RepID=UPI00164F06DA|nr:HK97 family phage prohead protease [Algoriphagus sp. AK58]MBC6365791.1 HK97 family phage prohead protease [Algoriphagus sp. AK58]